MDIRAILDALTPEERDGAVKAALDFVSAKGLSKWQPNPGPQSDAYFSLADELLYGGEPGGGKTELCLGLAFTQHKRTLFLRRQYTDLGFATDRAIRINGTRDGFSGQPPPKLRTADDRLIDFGAAKMVGDEQSWMGNPHDLLACDEATQLAESQVRFLMGWLRSEDKNQRCRVVLATNPALRPEGLWVNKMFAPWLDPNYPRPAKPAELRYYYTDSDGDDCWVDGPGEFEVTIEGKSRMVRAKSRTFIGASVKDNPHYVETGYQSQLDAMPEPFRSILLGGFRTTFADQHNQVIPTAWVRAAVSRWKNRAPDDIPLCSIGVDATGGGKDPMVVARRHDGWFAPLIEVSMKDVPPERIGYHCAGLVMSYRTDAAPVIIDMGGGYGMSTYEKLKENGVAVESFKGAEKSTRRVKSGKMGFSNRRTEIAVKFAEALDPSREGGSPIALPDDPELIADLTSLAYDERKLDGVTLALEPKIELVSRLGRSTNKGDAVLMCWAQGARNIEGMIRAGRGNILGMAVDYLRGRRPKVIMRRPK